jgi:uncharacterized membrane protein YoaK (UPF0700 family)
MPEPDLSPFDQAKSHVGTPGIAAALATAGGFLDGITYIGHGHVFANAMTGNVVLLGIDILSGSLHTALRRLLAIAAFGAGVSLSQAIQLYARRRNAAPPYTAILLLEAAVLLVLGLLPASTPDVLFTTCIAFAASVQVQTFREVRGQTYNSTFTTGNLRTLAEAVVGWIVNGRRESEASVIGIFALICAAFLAGAAGGASAQRAFDGPALFLEVLMLVAIALRVRHCLRIADPSQK